MPSDLQTIGPKSDEKVVTNVINQNMKKIMAEDTIKVWKDENGIPQVMVGRQAQGGSAKFKVAQPGIDVTTATDNELIMSSDFNMFKIIQTGQVTLVGGDTDGVSYTETVTHGLGYRPMVFVQCELPAAAGGETVSLPFILTQWDGTGLTFLTRVKVSHFVTDTELTFSMSHDSLIGAEDFIFKYYIVAETGVTAV